MLIGEEQLKFVRLFKVTVLNLLVIIMKPKFKLIISAARSHGDLKKLGHGARFTFFVMKFGKNLLLK